MELKTARLTVLIDPASKQAFEDVCHAQDMTPSQVVRRLIREYMAQEAPPRRAAPRKTAAAKATPRRSAAGKAAPRKAPAAKAPARKAPAARKAPRKPR